MMEIEDLPCDSVDNNCGNNAVGIYLDDLDVPFAFCLECKMGLGLIRIDGDKNQLSKIRNLIEETTYEIVNDFEDWGECLQVGNNETYDGTSSIGALQRLCMAKTAIVEKHYSKEKV